jgi:hypothetical protein
MNLELTKKETDLIYSSLKLYIKMAEVSIKNTKATFTNDEADSLIDYINTAGLLIKKLKYD